MKTLVSPASASVTREAASGFVTLDGMETGETIRAWCSALASIPIAPTGTAMASGFLVAGPLHGVVAQSESGLV
jgi:hypothetical protein